MDFVNLESSYVIFLGHTPPGKKPSTHIFMLYAFNLKFIVSDHPTKASMYVARTGLATLGLLIIVIISFLRFHPHT